MKPTPIISYISVSSNLQYCRLSHDLYLQDAEGVAKHIFGAVDAIIKFVDENDFPVSRRAAQGLKSIHSKMDQEDFVYEDDIELLAGAADSFRTAFWAEAEGKEVLVVTDKRIDVTKLLTDVPALFGTEVFQAQTDIAQHDFVEAGKCIAMELPTAAACLLLRGTEASLRDFYLASTKTDRVPQLLWGDMVRHLWQLRIPNLQPLLRNLDNIRDSFRNPTLHPEKIYDIDEVQDLFNLCVEVVNRMTNATEKN